MDWIKVTPDTMPPDEVSVMATVERNGKRRVFPEVRFSENYECWQYPAEACMDYWEDIDGVVTHWAHYPKPAED